MAKPRSTLLSSERIRSGVQAPRQYLTGFDIFGGHVGIPVILVYRKGFDIAHAKKSLAEALKFYPMIAGRYRKDDEGHAYVDCNDAGVDWRVHRCEGAMPYGPERPLGSDIKHFFKMLYIWKLFGQDQPLLQIDIYQYADEGIVLCCYGPHSLFDGSAWWQFMTDWSKACLGQEIKPHSYDHETVIAAGRANMPTDGSELNDAGLLYDPPMSRRLSLFAQLGWRAVTDMRKEVFRIPASTIQKWKEQAKAELPAGAGVSSAELVTAFCMKVISPLMPPDCERSVGIVLDLRHKRRLKLPRDYFGNALCYGEARYSPQEIAQSSLPVLAEKCRPSTEQGSTETLSKLLGLMETYRQKKAVWKLFMKPAGETLTGGLILNNCAQLPMYDIDLGRGAPDWYDICAVAFRMLMIVQTPEKDGGLDLHFTTRKRELAAMRQSLKQLGL